MRIWAATLAFVAGAFGAAGVALAAAGAHLATTPVVTTAAYFLLFHASALTALSVAAALAPKPMGLCLSGSALAIGTVLFSGDLALRGLAGWVVIRLAAPTGGMILIAGWFGVAVTLSLVIRALASAR